MDNVTNIEPADRKEAFLKAILEELAQGGGGGGGDFSTATVKVQMEEGASYDVRGAFLYQDELDSYSYGADTVSEGVLDEITMILYKNNGELSIEGNFSDITIVEGDAELVTGVPVVVHGNCTISITHI